MQKAPDGRRIHHWIGRDRDKDIAALAEAIAESACLYNHDDTFVRLDPTGELIPVNLAGLQEVINKSICGVRVVRNDTGWRREYFTWPFDTPARRPPIWETGLQRGKSRTTGPDAQALRQIYLEELLWRLPRVETGA